MTTTPMTEVSGEPLPESTGKMEGRFSDPHRENAEERIRESGPGAELLRRMYVKRLTSYMEAFYEHSSLADVVALCRALELSEEIWSGGELRQAPLVESFLGMFGVEPAELFNRTESPR